LTDVWPRGVLWCKQTDGQRPYDEWLLERLQSYAHLPDGISEDDGRRRCLCSSSEGEKERNEGFRGGRGNFGSTEREERGGKVGNRRLNRGESHLLADEGHPHYVWFHWRR
jgi:hypothetical protein